MGRLNLISSKSRASKISRHPYESQRPTVTVQARRHYWVWGLAVLTLAVVAAAGSRLSSASNAPIPANNIISLASVNAAGDFSGNGPSRKTALSANGRFLVFTSSANDLTAIADTNDAPDVFVRDLLNNTTELISHHHSSSNSGNGASGFLDFESTIGISADGRYVVYASNASDLIPTDTNGATDVFVYDRNFGVNRLVSCKSSDLTLSANGISAYPVISANGETIVFRSGASDLSASSDTNSINDVYAFNTNTLVNKLVSANLAGTNSGNDGSGNNLLSVSDDGRFVAFESNAGNLVSNDTNGAGVNGADVFVRDLQTNTTSLVSANSAGTGSSNSSSVNAGVQISGNGHFVVFASNATDLVTGKTDVNAGADIFRRDLVAGTTSLVSIDVTGARTGLGTSSAPSISNDGRFVAFTSAANDLVATDTNNGLLGSDVFVRDLQAGTTELVSINNAGTDSGNNPTSGPAKITSDGRYVLFISAARNLTSLNKLASTTDLYLRDLITDSTKLISINRFGTDGGGANPPDYSMSSDNSTIAWESQSGTLVSNDNNGLRDIYVFAPPRPGLSVNDVTITEGDTGTKDAVFTITLTNGPQTPVTATAIVFSGTAGVPEDIQAISQPLTFNPGETTKTVTVPVVGDLIYEGSETFTLELRDVVGSSVADGVGVGTIVENDPIPSLSVNDITIVEGDSGTKDAVFTVTLSGPSAFQVSFGFQIDSGTATENEDFQDVGGGESIGPDLKRTITVPIIGDTITEGNETFFLNIGDPLNATIADSQGVATIQDNETPASPPTFQFSQKFLTVSEGAGSLQVTVTRSGNTSSPASVDYLTSPSLGDSSSDRSDFTLALGTLRFAAGETTKSFTFLLTNDAFVEGNEFVQASLSNPTGGTTIGEPRFGIIKIVDDDVTPTAINPIDNVSFFVRQHYHDFLNREPDDAGRTFWEHEITLCGTDPVCIEAKRINVSAAFFLSVEFQETGYLVYRTYKTAFGNLPGGAPVPVEFTDFLRDTQQIGNGVQVGIGDWEAKLEMNKQDFALEFVQRAKFLTAFPAGQSADQFVTQLDANAGGVLSAPEKANLVTQLGENAQDVTKRAQVLRAVAENADLKTAEFNKAFVLMQYFGYLRRDPNDAPDNDYSGYNFWLTKLNTFGGNFVNADMVKAFLVSSEYRQRFGQ